MVSASNFKSIDDGKFSQTAIAFLPAQTIIPLEEFEPAEIIIKAGDTVKEGQAIAKSKNSYIHSSIPGIVKEIFSGQFSNGKQGKCARISLKGSLSFTGKKTLESDFSTFDRSAVNFLLKEADVFNTFDFVPVYQQLQEISSLKEKCVFLRLFDDDPSRLSEGFISKNYSSQVITGALILAESINADSLIVCQDKFNPVDFSNQIEKLHSRIKVNEIFIDTRKYPCGTKHSLVSNAKKQLNESCIQSTGIKDFFIDSLTALHSYNAVIKRIPVINNIIHVTGDCLNSAGIMNIKIGTPIRDVVDQCGGFKRKLSRIIINGTVKGTAISDMDIPVTKAIKSIEFVPAKQAEPQYSEICIRCGNCRKVCPASLWPGNLYRIARLSDSENYFLNSKDIAETAILCSDCGLCNAVCPSRLPLSQTISILKEKINEK